jgi:hypothetical protein
MCRVLIYWNKLKSSSKYQWCRGVDRVTSSPSYGVKGKALEGRKSKKDAAVAVVVAVVTAAACCLLLLRQSRGGVSSLVCFTSVITMRIERGLTKSWDELRTESL